MSAWTRVSSSGKSLLLLLYLDIGYDFISTTLDILMHQEYLSCEFPVVVIVCPFQHFHQHDSSKVQQQVAERIHFLHLFLVYTYDMKYRQLSI
jgi:hypothetical protein